MKHNSIPPFTFLLLVNLCFDYKLIFSCMNDTLLNYFVVRLWYSLAITILIPDIHVTMLCQMFYCMYISVFEELCNSLSNGINWCLYFWNESATYIQINIPSNGNYTCCVCFIWIFLNNYWTLLGYKEYFEIVLESRTSLHTEWKASSSFLYIFNLLLKE